MKKLQNLSCLVFTILLLASCEKKESEENKPAEQIPEEIVDPGPDKIRKVIRYNDAGIVQDSILFKYNSQKRVSRIEFGAFVNGRYKNKVDLDYTTNTNGANEILVRDSALATTGQYYLNTSGSFNVNADYKKAISAALRFQIKYTISYDSSGFVKSVNQYGQKQSDPFQHITFQLQNNNLTKFVSDSDLAGSYRIDYEYHPEPYLHDLYFNLRENGMTLFWNGQLSYVFNFSHSFLGKRNANLLKKQTIYSGQTDSTEISYQYEFNSLGLVSKIKTATISSRYGFTPMAIKYEIFYY